ncbi:xanthine dehydrogenase family protein molybdopterin-binding subunit [Actinoplanes sp. NPDC026623]|uniref:xanthine dehydrogenase family protein molybdopterin-binding subunit n=1 Tax=Actinoplanes sp. NPDC026623 TaxID=3155610 RepID=UPI0033C8756C
MTQPRVSMGSGRPRVEGRLKVTGAARYAADHQVGDVLYAVIVDSTIGRGRITDVDTSVAVTLPGVRAVISHRNAPRLPYLANPLPNNPAQGERLHALQDDRVHFFGQPVAVVVAGTLEQAQHAATLVRIGYDAETPSLDLASAPANEPITYARGDAGQALLDAPVRLDVTYRTARNHHNPMEPHAVIARWEGDQLTVWDKTQWIFAAQFELAAVFGIPQASVRVLSPYVGGGFGTSLRCWPHAPIAALAARELGRPVKLVLSRRQMYFGTGFRPSYEYRLRIGADRTGRLRAMTHDIRAETSRYENFVESILATGQVLYSLPHVSQHYATVPLDVCTPQYMRGPGYANAAYAIESAMDEVAYRVGVDPVELRHRNEPTEDESTGLPFSTRRLRECLLAGAREFGWSERPRAPRSTRDGDWLIGTGMAAGVYDTARYPAQSRARLDADGTAVVEAATSDMGPGTYTSMTQVAADVLGLDMDRVRFRLGDSLMPFAPPHGGSATMASVGSAVKDACDGIRRQAVTLAVRDPRSPLYGADPGKVVVRRGRLSVRDQPARGETYRRLLDRAGRDHLEAAGSFEPPTGEARYSFYGYAATFAEVAVDARLGIVRVRRMLGVYDAGRIINPVLADSQAIGGMVGGIGTALLEHTVTDPRDGRIANANLADYLVPVNADVPALRAIYVRGEDPEADPLGVKGLGELVHVGVAPAIANAVFHATGRRVRELPITAEMLQ